jgi:hypothetical protein
VRSQTEGDRTWDAWKRYWVNDGPKLILILLFLVLNAGLFMQSFAYYRWQSGKKYFPIYGYALPLARGAAAALKLDCCLIILMVLRNFISWYQPF